MHSFSSSAVEDKARMNNYTQLFSVDTITYTCLYRNAAQANLLVKKKEPRCIKLLIHYQYVLPLDDAKALHAIDRLVQERRNSSALAVGLRLSCTNSSKSSW